MQYPAIDWKSIDVVLPAGLEVSVCQWMNRRISVAECAANVNVGAGVGCDESSIVSAPCPGDLGDRRGSPGAAGEQSNDRNPKKDSHDLTLPFDTNPVNAGSR
jgi:hypothetical protein